MLVIVDSAEHTAIGHLPLRMAHKNIGLGLKLQNGDGLVHLGRKLLGLIIHSVAWHQLGHKLHAWVVAIHVERECG